MGRHTASLSALALAALAACNTVPEPDDRGESVGYRTGTAEDDFLSNGERGNVNVTEVNWAGSVRLDAQGRAVHDPGDVFIELQNKHPRPMHLTGWILTIDYGTYADGRHWGNTSGLRSRREFVIPPRVNGAPVEPNGFVTIAARDGGAFGRIPCDEAPEDVRVTADGTCFLADYYIEELTLPHGPFEITLRDLDERLIDGGGDDRKLPFAGAWDLVTTRSMERIQLIFNNRGNRDAAWHTYALSDWNDGDRGILHQELRRFVHPDYRARTFASPGMPNSPDYSGFVSSGDFQ
ncbi:MAG: hypothetical protein KC613_13480 [Myxococcales bacterium]|nr:hypothetical protein [Myxococcales bacterium]MCB9524766.1 hypothetical protein [Myxococcales bacterium]